MNVPAPDPAALQADVAKLLSQRWEELESVRHAGDSSATEQAAAYASYGLASFGNGQVIPAEAAFRNAVTLAPGEVRWVYFLALVHEYQGRLEAAADGFEAVLTLEPDNAAALMHLGDVRLEQARLDDARRAYEAVLEAEPDHAAAHYGLGRAASAAGNDEAAVRHFEAALELQPGADRINYLLGLAWRNLGDADKARDYLSRHGTTEPGFDDPLFDAVSGGKARIEGLWSHMNAGSQALVDGDYERAVTEFRQATANHPDDPASWQSLGKALHRTGDRDDAESAYRRALALSPDNAELHLELARVLLQAGRRDEAEQGLRRAIALDDRQLAARTALAELLAGSERHAEALQQFESALASDPQSGSLAISRAETLVALGRTEDAVAALAEASRINPRDTSVRLAYGLLLAQAGDGGAAAVEIRQALNLAEDDAQRARAHYALGQVGIARGDTGQAAAALEQALRLDPDHRQSYLALARLRARSRQYAEAVETYSDMLQRWPQADAVRVEAATAAILLQRGDVARRLLEDGAGRDAASPRLLSALARLLALSGQPGVHDPERALALAQRAYDKSGAVRHAETLALCLAAAGRFDDAIELQQRLVEAAGDTADAAMQARLSRNLQQYRAGRPGRLPFDAY